MTSQDSATNGDNDITLRDVVNHMSSIKATLITEIRTTAERLEKKIDRNAQAIKESRESILKNHKAITENRSLIIDNGKRIDVLTEDLSSLVGDSLKKRRHVGMSVEEY